MEGQEGGNETEKRMRLKGIEGEEEDDETRRGDGTGR